MKVTLVVLVLHSLALPWRSSASETEAIEVRVGAVPFRGEVTSGSLPSFPADAARLRVVGKVIVNVSCDGRGVVQHISTLESSGPEFTTAVTSALKNWRLRVVRLQDHRLAKLTSVLVFYFRFENDKPIVIDAAASLLGRLQ